ncbi:MAG: hypothetical protein SGCHY_001263 [Lobulomycetales sp.]
MSVVKICKSFARFIKISPTMNVLLSLRIGDEIWTPSLEGRIAQLCDLSVSEHEAMSRKSRDARKASLSGKALSRWAIKGLTGAGSSDLEFLSSTFGKPTVHSAASHDRYGVDSVRFSISHHGSWAVAAVSPFGAVDVGVDVCAALGPEDSFTVYQSCFSPKEWKWMFQGPMQWRRGFGKYLDQQFNI